MVIVAAGWTYEQIHAMHAGEFFEFTRYLAANPTADRTIAMYMRALAGTT